MRRNFKEYRIHFHPGTTQEVIHAAVADILLEMQEKGALPRFLHETGMSKKSALKKSYDLSRRDVLLVEMAKVVNERHWPGFARMSYWSEGELSNDRFVVRFSSNSRSFSWLNMVFIDIPERLAPRFEASMDSLRGKMRIGFVVFEFDPETSEVARALDERGNWHSSNDSSSSVEKIVSLVSASKQ